MPTLDQSYRLHLEIQRELSWSFRFTHRVLLDLIFTHQLSITFFEGKVNLIEPLVKRRGAIPK
jgi:hypothetical protein